MSRNLHTSLFRHFLLLVVFLLAAWHPLQRKKARAMPAA